MIKPTVGRVVLFHPHKLELCHAKGEPLAALVTKVHDDRKVNLAVFDESGYAHAKQDVVLVQEGDEPPKKAGYCEWMPYQKGQAAATASSSRK